jgi:glycosyltransferase involved in cell wall biosynthesis
MNKVLIVTYYWPPSGGAGVQRWLKFSKYLPEFGWVPVILTVDPSYAAYPVTDHSLNDDLPSSVKVYKTPAINYFSIYKKDSSKIPSAGFANSVDNSVRGKITRFIRGNFFLPDPRRGWNKYAFKKACELIESEEIQHVITTSPPHSTQLIGLNIKKKYPSIRWIADLRDPWTDIYYYKQFYPTYFSKLIDRRFEKMVLKNADKIITVGNSLKQLFSLKVKGAENKTDVITNGYDQDDFSGIIAVRPAKFTITYVGTLSDIYPVNGFLDALDKFKKNGNGYLLRFIGAVSQNQKDLIQLKVNASELEFIQYVDHSAAIKFMLNSTVLLLIIPDHESNKSIITGKIFEYLASGKPVVCLGPAGGDAAEIINSANAGRIFNYNESDKICNFLEQSSLLYKPVQNEILNYSRRELTGNLSGILMSASFQPINTLKSAQKSSDKI